MDPLIKKMMETGIKITKTQFHAAVNNADQVPENYFSKDSEVPSRRAEMWVHPSWSFILCRQLTSRKDMFYFFVPISTAIFGTFGKFEEELVFKLEEELVLPSVREMNEALIESAKQNPIEAPNPTHPLLKRRRRRVAKPENN